MFSQVSVCKRGVSAALHAEIHLPPEPEADTHPEQTHPVCSACWDMVNKRAVCIPLEWILVDFLNLIYFGIDYSGESRIFMRGCQEPKLVCSPSPAHKPLPLPRTPNLWTYPLLVISGSNPVADPVAEEGAAEMPRG